MYAHMRTMVRRRMRDCQCSEGWEVPDGCRALAEAGLAGGLQGKRTAASDAHACTGQGELARPEASGKGAPERRARRSGRRRQTASARSSAAAQRWLEAEEDQ